MFFWHLFIITEQCTHCITSPSNACGTLNTPSLIIPTRRILRWPAQILLQPRPLNHQRFAILQDKRHPRSLIRRVHPLMNRCPLYRHISPSHTMRLSIVEHHINLSLEDDTIIERLRSVHAT